VRARIAIAVGCLALPLAAGAAMADPISTHLHSETVTKAISGTVTSVHVDGDNSAVVIVPGRASSVTASLKWDVNRPTVTISLSKGVLTVKARCHDAVLQGPVIYVSGTPSCADDLRLVVPSATDVAVSTGGPVSISRVAGDLDLRGALMSVTQVRSSRVRIAATGEVHLESVTAPVVQASSSNGPVSARSLTSRSVTLSSGYGSVSATAVTARSLTASTAQGDVNVGRVRAALIDLSSGYGNVGAVDVDSPDVSATSDQGTVSVARLSGDRLSMKSGYGDVLVDSTSASHVTASSAQGQVNVVLTKAPDLARATSGYGAVSLMVPAGRYAVDASTSYGQTSVSGIVRDDSAPRQLIATSSQGDVTVTGR
jgi:hypothetical protein